MDRRNFLSLAAVSVIAPVLPVSGSDDLAKKLRKVVASTHFQPSVARGVSSTHAGLLYFMADGKMLRAYEFLPPTPDEPCAIYGINILDSSQEVSMDKSDHDRIDGRRWADDVLASLGDATDAYHLGFWRRIKRELPAQEIDPRAMSDVEAREFGKSLVTFGKHAKSRVDDVPLDYWEWLADENTKVQRYLRNRRITAERTGDADDE